MIGFGHWVFMIFIFIPLSIWFVHVQFEQTKQKILYFIAIFAIFVAFVMYAIYDWKKYTIEKYELTTHYLNLHYMSGRKELVAYHDIRDVNFFAQKGFRCGLSFYIQGKPNIRTISNIPCKDIHDFRKQIFTKTEAK